ncbi:hypothetical protein AGMMS49992_24330 [Clostridia bacterium]|nr:hypothetical protein AGMMS49992_24330 [Clostridia bacterium]
MTTECVAADYCAGWPTGCIECPYYSTEPTQANEDDMYDDLLFIEEGEDQ